MTLVNIVALTTTVIYLMLGGIIYIHSRRQTSENFFGLMSLYLTVWGLATFLTFSASQSITLFKVSAYIHYIAGNLVFLCLFWFSLYFPERKIKSLLIPVLVTCIDGALSIAVITTDFFFLSFIISPTFEKHILFNYIGYTIYGLSAIVLFISAEVILFK